MLPLIPRNEDMVEPVRARSTRSSAACVVAEYDDSGQIGRRYRRQDEIGTPFALTIDEQTLEDDTVTIRDRDSLAQERIPISGARALVLDRLAEEWNDAEVGLALGRPALETLSAGLREAELAVELVRVARVQEPLRARERALVDA